MNKTDKTNKDTHVEQPQFSYSAGRNLKQNSHFQNGFGKFSFDPEIPPVGMYSKAIHIAMTIYVNNKICT